MLFQRFICAIFFLNNLIFLFLVLSLFSVSFSFIHFLCFLPLFLFFRFLFLHLFFFSPYICNVFSLYLPSFLLIPFLFHCYFSVDCSQTVKIIVICFLSVLLARNKNTGDIDIPRNLAVDTRFSLKNRSKIQDSLVSSLFFLTQFSWIQFSWKEKINIIWKQETIRRHFIVEDNHNFGKKFFWR